MEDVFEHNLN